MKRINQLATLALTLVVFGGTLSETEAQRRGRQSAQNLVADENVDGVNDRRASRHRHGGQKRGRAGFADQLTTEQHSALKDQLSALRASGASATEISATLTAELTAAGVELPEDFAERAAQRETQRAERTVQREEIKALKDGLKAEGPRGQKFARRLRMRVTKSRAEAAREAVDVVVRDQCLRRRPMHPLPSKTFNKRIARSSPIA